MSGRLILAVDNSLDFLNLALAEEDRIIEERHGRQEHHPSEVLPSRVRELLSDHGFSVRDVSLLLVTLGPGSFTGIRVGIAFCKGLAEGLRIPLVGVPTLDVLATPLAFLEGCYLCPLVDAKKGEVFLALYRVSGGKLVRTGEFQACKPGEVASKTVASTFCFGSGVRLCRQELEGVEGLHVIEEGFQRVSGEALLRAGLIEAAQGRGLEAEPIYGRRSEAEIKFDIAVS
jgi:tRNA threonylcarbamoyladenosine biosynthesis protein TsaB